MGQQMLEANLPCFTRLTNCRTVCQVTVIPILPTFMGEGWISPLSRCHRYASTAFAGAMLFPHTRFPAWRSVGLLQCLFVKLYMLNLGRRCCPLHLRS